MARKKEVYRVKPLNENKKISGLPDCLLQCRNEAGVRIAGLVNVDIDQLIVFFGQFVGMRYF